jgi:GNAT superfamily N-acetyltransferase
MRGRSGLDGSFHVRPATAEDGGAFTALRIELFRETGGIRSEEQAGALARATLDAFAEGIRTGTCLAWLAFPPQGDAIGSAAMHVFDRLPSPQNPGRLEGYFAHLFIQRGWRRRGVGTALVEAALAEARRRRLGRVRLHATVEGRALYERLGFRLRTNDMELVL